MFIFFGLISLLLTILADYLIMAFIGISVHSFTLWFILPIGGAILGAFCGKGIFLYLKHANIKATAKHTITSAILAFIGFWAINYFAYFSTYVDDESINNTFKGEHISNYMYNDTEPFTFKNYLEFQFETSESVVSVGGHSSGSSISFGKGYNKTSFYITMLGFIIGGLTVGSTVVGDKSYCDKCKKYMKEKKLYDFTYSSFDNEVMALEKALQKTKEEFDDFIKQERPFEEYGEPYITAVLTYCPVCKDGFINLKFMEPKKGSGGKLVWEENDKYTKKLPLSNEASSMIV
ncbi:ribosomal protein L44E [Clostridium punense]|uniref:Ribosomal protein L44E n=2 Tax=Clostridium TaxID=1485 RepID=A0ABS4KA57_9CLOT|nr:hypothetical protein [Clostridium punense]MBP2024156.1 ribosomal protein L44E [Clostridium punense]